MPSVTWLPALSFRSGLLTTREGPIVSKSGARAPRGKAEFEVFCGIDVAREMHHAVALDAAGDRLVDRPLTNAEPGLVTLFEQLQVHGRVLVVVDQLASIGALAIAVARSRGDRGRVPARVVDATDRRPVPR